MTNHVHLLLTSDLADGVSSTLRYVGSRYVRRVNERYDRTGTLWESRFRSSPIDSEAYCLACYRYIELNPVRADMVGDPGAYRWSSYGINSTGKPSPLVTPHPSFLSLGATPMQCAERYRALVRQVLPENIIGDIREALQTGSPTGGESFRSKLEDALNRRLIPGRPGRPRKAALPR